MKKSVKFIITGVITLIFIRTFVLLWFKSHPQPGVYNRFTPKMSGLKEVAVITGKMGPRNKVSVKPQISSTITGVMKEAGEMVQAGEIIAKVEVVPDMN